MVPERNVNGRKMANSESKKSHASRLTAFLGLQRSTVGVLAMVVLVGMGERMAERFLPIYMLALGGGALAYVVGQAEPGVEEAAIGVGPGEDGAGHFLQPLDLEDGLLIR